MSLQKNKLALFVALAMGTLPTSALAESYTYTGDAGQLEIFELSEDYNNAIYNGDTIFGSGEGGVLSNNIVNIESIDNLGNAYGAMESTDVDMTLSNNIVNINAKDDNSNQQTGGTDVYGVLAVSNGGNITANNNTININKSNSASNIWGDVVRAESNETGGNITANNNTLNITNISKENAAIGFSAVDADSLGKGSIIANNNNITLNNTFIKNIYPDEYQGATYTSLTAVTARQNDQTINASNNNITIKNSDINSLTYISNVQNVNYGPQNNELQDSKGVINNFNSNSIDIINSSIQVPIIDNNHDSNIYTVESEYAANITNNSMLISGSTIDNIRFTTVLADGEKGNVIGNSLNIENSTIKNSPNNIIATVQSNGAGDINFFDNALIIGDDVVFDDNVILAAVYLDGEGGNTKFNNNRVSLSSNSNLASADIYGVYIDVEEQNLRATSNDNLNVNNTLEIHSYNQTTHVNSVNNFNTYQFFIEGDEIIDDALLTTNKTVALANSGQTADIGITINGNASLSKEDELTLFNNVDAEGSEYASEEGKNITVKKGAGAYYDANVKLDGDELKTEITSDLKQNSTSKALVEPQSAALAFLNQGGDLIVSQFAPLNQAKWQAFGGYNGGSSRYNTGSHIQINGSSMILGAAFKQDAITMGAFFEMGFANYHSHNNETAGEIYGSGKTNYKGVGALARFELDNQMYVDGYLRVGKAKVDYETGDIQVDGVNAGYNTSATYFGASFGGGKSFALNETSNVDLSARYTYTRLPGKDIVTNLDHYDFNNSHSHRAQLDGTYSINLNEWLVPYAGLGYQYEFSGNSSAQISGVESEKTRLQGSTGSLALGLRGNTSAKNFSYDLGVKGFVGKREGVIGSVNVNYQF